jgi:hypothetical protein
MSRRTRRGVRLDDFLDPLVAAQAEWEPCTAVFPDDAAGNAEHTQVCSDLGMWAGDYSTWSQAHRKAALRDLKRALELARSRASGAEPPSKP